MGYHKEREQDEEDTKERKKAPMYSSSGHTIFPSRSNSLT